VRAALPCLLTLLASACAAPDRHALPEGSGAGLLYRDADPPPGAEICAAPQWQQGQRFTLVAGGWARAEFVVAATGPAGHELAESSGLRQFFTSDFAIAGQEVAGAPASAVTNDPPDPILDFPLWPGKRWSAEFARRSAGADAALLARADYLCETWETLRVPAGEMRALRILRRLRRADDPAGEEQVALYWWAPEAGFFARKLEDGVLLELEEARRP